MIVNEALRIAIGRQLCLRARGSIGVYYMADFADGIDAIMRAIEPILTGHSALTSVPVLKGSEGSPISAMRWAEQAKDYPRARAAEDHYLRSSVNMISTLREIAALAQKAADDADFKDVPPPPPPSPVAQP